MHFDNGTIVDKRFRIIRPLGRGGMGAVYEVEDVKTGTKYALKSLLPEFATSDKALARFEREVRTAGRLKHPNLVGLVTMGRHEGLPYFVMEYLEGQALRSAMKDRGQYSVTDAWTIIGPACDALKYAHGHGLVHRDISPENIFISNDGAVKLLDFGLVHEENAQQELTRTGASLGKLAYMAPEQLRDSKSVDARADVYSLGVVLFEMLTGELPIGNQRAKTLAKGLPLRVDRLLRDALAPIDSRMNDAGSFQKELSPHNQRRFTWAILPTPHFAQTLVDNLAVEMRDHPYLRYTVLCVLLLVSVYATFRMGDAAINYAREYVASRPEIVFDSGEQDIAKLEVSPDNQFLAAVVNEEAISVWDIQSGELLNSFEPSVLNSRSQRDKDIMQLVFMPDSKQLLYAGRDHEFGIWNLETNLSSASFHHFRSIDDDVYVTPNGRWASWLDYDDIRVSALTAGAKPTTISHRDDNDARSSAISRNGLWALYVGAKIVMVVNLETDERTIIIDHDYTYWLPAAITDNGRFALCGKRNGEAIAVFDVETKSVRYQFDVDLHILRPPKTNDSSDLAYLSGESFIHIWRLASGELLMKINRENSERGSPGAWSPNGKYIVFSRRSGETRALDIWNIEQNQRIRTFNAHRTQIKRSVFTPNSRQLIVATEAGKMYVYPLPE